MIPTVVETVSGNSDAYFLKNINIYISPDIKLASNSDINGEISPDM